MPKPKRSLENAGSGYNTWANALARKRGVSKRELEQDDYDYKGFYNSNPIEAYNILADKTGAHFPDTYKRPTHPTFSDESIYSGKAGNLVGGHWLESPYTLQKWTYRLSPEQVRNNWNVKRTLEYAGYAEDQGFRITDNKGRYPVVDGVIHGGVLPAVTVRTKKKGGGTAKTKKYSLDEAPTRNKDGSYNINYNGDDYTIQPSALNSGNITVTTPEVVVKGKRPYSPYSFGTYVPFEYSRNSYYRPEDALEAFNTITGGGLNWVDPTQWARRVIDLVPLATGDMSMSEYGDRWINGNEGLVTGNFAKNHPIASMLFNGVVGGLPYAKGLNYTTRAKSIWDAGKAKLINAADKYIFIPHKNTYTRGIGMTDAGLQDAINTGVFRGNPRGTEQTAKIFDKMFLRNRNNFRDIVKDTGIKGIESRYQSRTLTEKDFYALKRASKKIY